LGYDWRHELIPPTIFRFIFAIIVEYITKFVANAQAVTTSTNDLSFFVEGPGFYAESSTIDLENIPAFPYQTFVAIVPQLAIDEFPLLSRLVTPRFVENINAVFIDAQIFSGEFIAKWPAIDGRRGNNNCVFAGRVPIVPQERRS
jgi:hypothetical protein